MTPRLVVMTGYFSSGKTTISKYLEELGFTTLCSDLYRKKLVGPRIGILKVIRDSELFEREKEVWKELDMDKRKMLGNGYDVVVDSQAENDNMRRYLLNTNYDRAEINPEKYLIIIRADKEILSKRECEEGIKWCDENWTEPDTNLDCEIIEYKNNVPDDLEHIRKDLMTKFGG